MGIDNGFGNLVAEIRRLARNTVLAPAAQIDRIGSLLAGQGDVSRLLISVRLVDGAVAQFEYSAQEADESRLTAQSLFSFPIDRRGITLGRLELQATRRQLRHGDLLKLVDELKAAVASIAGRADGTEWRVAV